MGTRRAVGAEVRNLGRDDAPCAEQKKFTLSGDRTVMIVIMPAANLPHEL